jgi:hypothetical protein
MRNLIFPVMCLLLMGAVGCGPTHPPVPITVVAPTMDGAPPTLTVSEVLAEKGTTLTFELPPGSAQGTTLEVEFKNMKGEPVDECRDQAVVLKGLSPLTCRPKKEGDFTITLTVIAPGGHRHKIPTPVKAYIRPCKACSA